MSQLLSSKGRPINSTFKTPFINSYSNDDDPMMCFKAAAAAKEGISTKAFIVLDDQTLRDGGKTCRLSTHDDDRDEETYHARVALRCKTSCAVAALNILEQSTDGNEQQMARSLRNEAAIAGGIWSEKAAARQHEHAKIAHIRAAEYPQSQDWNLESGCCSAGDSRPYIPVFCTADIDLEVCKALDVLFLFHISFFLLVFSTLICMGFR